MYGYWYWLILGGVLYFAVGTWVQRQMFRIPTGERSSYGPRRRRIPDPRVQAWERVVVAGLWPLTFLPVLLSKGVLLLSWVRETLRVGFRYIVLGDTEPTEAISSNAGKRVQQNGTGGPNSREELERTKHVVSPNNK